MIVLGGYEEWSALNLQFIHGKLNVYMITVTTISIIHSLYFYALECVRYVGDFAAQTNLINVLKVYIGSCIQSSDDLAQVTTF